MGDHTEKLAQAFAAIDAANAEDPNTEEMEGERWPKELLYGRRMSDWLARLRPEAPAALQLAARAQHVRRWEIPRDTFPRDRTGYLKWRKKLYKHHAETAAQILAEVGYDDETIERVKFLLQKKRLTSDPDTQSLEDAACLVFLQHHFAEFAQTQAEEKLVSIVQKTWGKMSEQARAEAMKLDMPAECGRVIEKALGAG